MEAISSQQSDAELSPRFNLIFGLLCRCPAVTQSDCVLAEQRKLPMQLRYQWARGLTEDQLERIYQHHHRCLQRQSRRRSIPVKLFD